VWGLSLITTCQGHKYFATFTDNVTRYIITYLLCTKDEALEAYKLFKAWAIMQGHCTAIKVLRSDHSGEYLSGAFNQHLKKAGMVRKLTTHNTHS
jgi:transposase InsO family protein